MVSLFTDLISLSDPHQVLGLHFHEDGKIIRLFREGAPYLYIELFGERVEMKKVDDKGLFSLSVPSHTVASDYRVYLAPENLNRDPYSFLPTWGSLDLHLFTRGLHYKLYEKMGGRPLCHEGVQGVAFSVWAPYAKGVFLVGDFNNWHGQSHPMRSLGSSGVWELFIPGLEKGEKYKFDILTHDGKILTKSDPYALFGEKRPKSASIVFDVDQYQWNDHLWEAKKRKGRDENTPMLIYEVHLASWKREGEDFVSYRKVAPVLAKYCKEMGFTHVELMPIMEHPLDESWGYQVTGFFAATSRQGDPSDFQYLIDTLHQEGIGVILDWVPAHFPTDPHGLSRFDGSHLYEHADPRQGFHPHWNTAIFNYGRAEVSNFLIASALFWLDKMHIDGIRVDAVASMLYLDYGRKAGEWIPNQYGGHHNLEAIEWMKHFNSILEEKFPGVHRFAEESTAFPGVTRPVSQGGLGFTMKWSLGWMNDTLRYFARDPLYRCHHQQELTFFLLYAFSEKYVLSLSHDEVVHGKASLLSKMPGDDWQKFANLKLLYSYQICQPGKKLLFMGGELGDWEEWKSGKQLPWHLLDYDRHQALHRFFREINHFYCKESGLWERDFSDEGFEWVDTNDCKNCVLSYFRKAKEETLLIVHNFTPSTHSHYRLLLPKLTFVQEVFNTDREEYGGSGKLNRDAHLHAEDGHRCALEIALAPLATMIFKVSFV